MEIVRAQPFFSQKSHMLRDQLEEYVNGFPATRAHREIIARAYHVKEEEKFEVPPSHLPKEKESKVRAFKPTKVVE